MSQTMPHDLVTDGAAQSPYYDAKSVGAPFGVRLTNGVRVTTALGKTVTTIVDLPGLIAAIVRMRVLHPRKLSGADLKFIRSALGVKSKDLADAIPYTPEHYSRCEASKKAMPVTVEKAYRAHVYLATLLKDKGIQQAIKSTLEEQRKKAEISPEQAKKAASAFYKLFMEMKIQAMYDPKDDLIFTLSHCARQGDDDCGDEDDEPWRSEPELDAA